MTAEAVAGIAVAHEDSCNNTVPALLVENALRHGDRLGVQFGTHSRTFAELVDVSERLLGGLLRAGVEPHERVALLLPNRAEILDLFFAMSALRAIQVPLNIFLRGEFLRYQLVDCGATTVITDSDGLADITKILAELPQLRRVILLDGDSSTPIDGDKITLMAYTDLLQGPRQSLSESTARANDILSIMYTSGTTGMPKGCMLTHGYYRHVGRAFASFFEMVADDHMASMMPLYHMGAFCTGVMPALNVGAACQFTEAFSASQFMGDAQQSGATIVCGAGPMAKAILAGPADRDHDSRLRMAIFAPLDPASQEAFEQRFGVPVLAEGYGQTECLPVSYSPLSTKSERGSSGPIAPWLDVRLVDDDDNPVATGDVGEIAVRPNIPHAMFSGYWAKPDDTLNAWRGLWHHTGDLGRFSEDGVLSYVDRKKDAMRRRGENVSSVQVESVIERFDGVAEVAVHAVPSPLGEDDIKACIVERPGSGIRLEELFEFLKNKLPYFAVPRYIEIVDQLPRNQIGRVMKHRLRELGITSSTVDLEERGLTVRRGERRG